MSIVFVSKDARIQHTTTPKSTASFLSGGALGAGKMERKEK